MSKLSSGFQLFPRFRIQRGDDVALGPGKVELLEHIHETGSIANAAKRMEMSYMRAWTLLKTMEGCFRERLIKVKRGGAARGGAVLTAAGKRAVDLYRQIEKESAGATTQTWQELRTLLRD